MFARDNELHSDVEWKSLFRHAFKTVLRFLYEGRDWQGGSRNSLRFVLLHQTFIAKVASSCRKTLQLRWTFSIFINNSTEYFLRPISAVQKVDLATLENWESKQILRNRALHCEDGRRKILEKTFWRILDSTFSFCRRRKWLVYTAQM